jgi:uncharacterized repeat protein (TIGR01451 family)
VRRKVLKANFQKDKYRRLGKSLTVAIWINSLFSVQLPAPVFAETQAPSQCPLPAIEINNRALFDYSSSSNPKDAVEIQGISNETNSQKIERDRLLQVVAAGATDSQGNYLVGSVFGSSIERMRQLGLSETQADAAAIALTATITTLSEDSTFDNFLDRSQEALLKAVPEKRDRIESLYRSGGEQIGLQFLSRLFQAILVPVNLSESEREQAIAAAFSVLLATQETSLESETLETAFQAAAAAIPAKSVRIQRAFDDFLQGSDNFNTEVSEGETLKFDYLLVNLGDRTLNLKLSTAENVTTTANNSINLDRLTIPPQSQVKVTVAVKVNEIPLIGTTVGVRLSHDLEKLEIKLHGSATLIGMSATTPTAIEVCPSPQLPTPLEQVTIIIPPPPAPTPNPPGLVDPLGRVTGCGGETLEDYRGFSVGFYEPDPNDLTGGIGEPVALTPTGQGTNFAGIEPNLENSNPFFLSTAEEGKYSFLLDANRGQLDAGDTYILVVNPPEDSTLSERRVRIVIDSRVGNLVTYTATSLDGRPISSTNNATSLQQTIRIEDANRIGIILAVLNLNTSVCQAQEIQISKIADRAAAEPGDTVIYRLLIRNLSVSKIRNITVTDNLPLGFQLRSDSVRAESGKNRVAIATERNGSTVTFNAPNVTIPANETLTIVYAVVLTPDALRGSGENTAIVEGERAEPPIATLRDGPALFRLRIRPGLLADSGTIVGRVFEDKNFDSEQQSGEPGIPNAVVFLDDGTRIVTDPNGLFSVANVQPGDRTGVLDLSSLPGYTLAPNLYFNERNSQSRLVRLEPGGLVRMNFAVTPAFREGSK